MKKKTLKKIQAINQHLDEHFVEGKLKVTGQEIIDAKAKKAIAERADFKHPKDSDGNEIDPERTYLFDAEVKINHTRRMKRLFQTGGIKAVREYVESVIASGDQAWEGHLNVLASMPVQPMSI